MDRVPPPRARRALLTRSHRVAIGVAAVVVSAVAVLALVLTRADRPGPPDGTYRLVARDSALCLTVASSPRAPGVDPPAAPAALLGSASLVGLSTCPEAGGSSSTRASGTVVARGAGMAGPDLAVLGSDGLPADAPGGRWTVRSADGPSRLAFRPAAETGLCLAVTARASVSPVALQPCRASGTQTWTLRQVGRSDYYQVVADQGRRCLDAVTVDGAVTAVEKMCSSEPSQQWRFDPAD